MARRLKEIREDNEFNEIDLNQFREKLLQLEEELHKPRNVSINQENTLFINKIFITVSSGKSNNHIYI